MFEISFSCAASAKKPASSFIGYSTWWAHPTQFMSTHPKLPACLKHLNKGSACIRNLEKAVP
jgi:hypothetical protein